MTTPVLILPGLGGSGPDHWQRHLLGAVRHAQLLEQADWNRPNLAAWQGRLEDALALAPGAILVAHSLACALVAHVAARRPDLPVGGALLVAPADVDAPGSIAERVATFRPMPLRPMPWPAIVVASHDDPCITFARAGQLAEAWRAQLVDLGASGHINIASGFGQWPLAGRLTALLARAASRRKMATDASTGRHRPGLTGAPAYGPPA